MSATSSSLCYETNFGRNLEFPKIKEFKNVCSDVWTCIKMLKQCYFQLYYIQTLFICSKMAFSCSFSKGGNLEFLDFLQKKVLEHRLQNKKIFTQKMWSNRAKPNLNPNLSLTEPYINTFGEKMLGSKFPWMACWPKPFWLNWEICGSC